MKIAEALYFIKNVTLKWSSHCGKWGFRTFPTLSIVEGKGKRGISVICFMKQASEWFYAFTMIYNSVLLIKNSGW